MSELKILLVHGVGHQEASRTWSAVWEEAITNAIRSCSPAAEIVFEKVQYDTLFEQSKIDTAIIAEAVARLMASGVVHGIGDLFARPRGLFDIVRWTAGMVAQWAADEDLRKKTRAVLLESVNTFKPDVICSHSLGSLISYDLFAQNGKPIEGRTFVSFGSQIGHPFVRSIFGGRLVVLAGAKQWHHLYNKEDDVFTAPIRLSADNFEQVATFFDIPGYMDHDPKEYLSHPNAVDRVWRHIAAPLPKTLNRAMGAWRTFTGKPEKRTRALLVGINEYPNPADRLEGCVNDVFRMSETLQEWNFAPENIRVVLNDRATAQGIRERLEWLLEDAGEGDARLFYYSGHGAQIPNYGEDDEVDHQDECLVPFDFDWTPDRAIIDDHFRDLYSQLPYAAQFIAVFDCCHSGGMTRNGSLKVRGLNPPDDIRHRSLSYEKGMWIPRELRLAKKNMVAREEQKQVFLGRSGSVKRLGRAISLWAPSAKAFEKAKAAYGHSGPYMPILLQACREEQYSYEYRHGVTSYGAFTYSITEILRAMRRQNKRVTFPALVGKVTERLKGLGYDQTPVLVIPKPKQNQPIPFPAKGGKAGRR